MSQKKACFFAWLRRLEAFRLAEWYRTDIRILQELGFEVSVANSPRHLRPDSDLYFGYWWNLCLPALALARLRGKPLVVVGNIKPKQGLTARGLFERASTWMTFRYGDAVLATSRAEYDDLSRLNIRRLHLVYHGIDTDYYSPASELPDNAQIMTVSHLAYGNMVRKCLEEAIRACALVIPNYPGLKYVIVGGGSESALAYLKSVVAELGIGRNVVFAGRVSTEEKLELYRSTQLYLQPTRHEGFGVAIAEAMACGLPVVSSPVGAVPEVVGDAGVLVDGTQPAEIARAVHRVLSDEPFRIRLRQAGRERIVGYFSFSHRKREMAELIRGVGIDMPPTQGAQSEPHRVGQAKQCANSRHPKHFSEVAPQLSGALR